MDKVDAAIPNKLFFRIGEVSQLIGVEAHVLRYWESEFKELAPRKSDSGQRMFRRKDVELLLEIKQLLYDKKFTIEGARKELHGRGARNVIKSTIVPQKELFPSGGPLPLIRKELAAIVELLK